MKGLSALFGSWASTCGSRILFHCYGSVMKKEALPQVREVRGLTENSISSRLYLENKVLERNYRKCTYVPDPDCSHPSVISRVWLTCVRGMCLFGNILFTGYNV